MSATTRIVLWRHGNTDYNAEGRFQGQRDIPLNRRGIAQADHVAQLLAQMKPDAVYSSPLKRAMATAQSLCQLIGIEPATDRRLEEINVGTWAGFTLAEIMQAHPDFAQALAEHRDARRSSTGETATETGVRMGEVIREIAAAHQGKIVVVASHGLAIRMGTANVLGWGYPTAIALSTMQNCAWSQLDLRDGWWRLHTWNHNPHVTAR